ncbi:MAG TPA: Mut7-C RNAse domain-containing protein [Methanolinea sp.]|nr:Mut7-C RNAse domain-containing protein [Methanolinea sp.]
MSGTPDDPTRRTRFLADRMLGTLCRYLRFMGYDTESASGYREGNTREDTLLLKRAQGEGRVLLTMDRELARRGGEGAILLEDRDVMEQLRVLTRTGLIVPALRLNRCSLCNTLLRAAREDEVSRARHAPRSTPGMEFFWCPRCRKLYWQGSHGKDLEKRIKENILKD